MLGLIFDKEDITKHQVNNFMSNKRQNKIYGKNSKMEVELNFKQVIQWN